MRNRGMNILRRAIVMASLLAAGLGAHAATPAEIATAKAYAKSDLAGLDPAVVDGAAKEGELMVYHLIYPKGLNGVFGAFKKRFPFVDVKSFAASGGPLYERYRTEEKAGRSTADIWQHTSAGSADTLAKEGILMNWTPPNDGRVPAQWKRAGSWYPIGLFYVSLAWNDDAVSPEEQKLLRNARDWNVALDPRWKGRMGLVHVRAGGTTHLPYYFYWKSYGEKYLDGLAAAKPLVLDSIVPLAERLASGEVSMIPLALDTIMANQLAKGVKMRWVYPEPALASAYVMAASAKSPHPNAAKLFLTWSLSKEGQAAWVEASNLAPVSPDVEDRRPFVKEPWFHKPEKHYSYQWSDIDSSLPQLFKVYEQAFR